MANSAKMIALEKLDFTTFPMRCISNCDISARKLDSESPRRSDRQARENHKTTLIAMFFNFS